MTKEVNEGAGDADGWETAELKVRRPSTSVVSVRMPAELVVELESYANQHSLTISEAIRTATEQLLQVGGVKPTYAFLGTTEAPVLKLAGPTVLIQAVTTAGESQQLNIRDRNVANWQERLAL